MHQPATLDLPSSASIEGNHLPPAQALTKKAGYICGPLTKTPSSHQIPCLPLPGTSCQCLQGPGEYLQTSNNPAASPVLDSGSTCLIRFSGVAPAHTHMRVGHTLLKRATFSSMYTPRVLLYACQDYQLIVLRVISSEKKKAEGEFNDTLTMHEEWL